ncbi:sugar ABC transporter substrate-binding protein [Clavibacter sp. VKM Ac-2873]|uniref:sugar ABC transporter substrate-binding protein n=1 Tax=Clavibacter sp. VKM Ac-2873 TaxID=2783813 RepID=UPI00188D5128|nr:sugar ABC transporter substrate-binding protein [Clavibacter sp. VKM Ac-2873]MBF4617890.1 sugar ABC transporter substrate-binding protein [Clavibacter sp. VKM Ac-2873]
MKKFSLAGRTLAVVSAFALAGSVSACSTGGGSSSSSDDGQPLEVWTRSTADAAKTYEKVFADFTAKTGIEVNYQAVEEFDTQLAARASEKDLPDVMINDAASLGNYTSQGLLLPIDQSSIDGQDDIDQSTWDQNKGLDGSIYGVPFSRQTNVLIVRKDWREKLGLDQPRTWDDLTAMATAFANQDPDGDGKADTYGMVVPGTAKSAYIARWGAPYIWQAGGDIIESDGEGTYKSVIDSPETAEAMSFIRTQFCTPGNVVPGSLNLTTGDSPFFAEGTAGMYLTGPYNIPNFDRAVGKDNVEVVPMPSGPASTTTFAEGENIYFGASSTKAEQQKALAEYLISPEAQKLAMDVQPADSTTVSQPVVRLPVNKDVDVAEVLGDPRWKVVADSYDDDAKTFTWSINYNPIRQALADGMNAMMSDCNSDIGAGLASIDSTITSELKNQDLLK